MDVLRQFIDIFLHVDKHLAELIQQYGTLTYAILFAIIFCETGLIVTPFLPGDSLLFAAGALCTVGTGETDHLNVLIVAPLIVAAALCGDLVNYSVGYKVGPGFLEKGKIRFVKREYLERTQKFYEKHGGKTIIIARFMPIIRTFAPFVAGIGRMEFRRYIVFCVAGACLWSFSIVGAGYFFGNIPIVKNNFTAVIFMIIGISVLPLFIQGFQAWRARRSSPSA